MENTNIETRVDYNIEYSHIYYKYADKLITGEHEQSIEITKQLIATLESLKKSYCLVVMIDTSMREHCNLDQIFQLLGQHGLRPDFVINESAFCDAARSLVKRIPRSNRETTKRGDVSFILKLEDEKKKVKLLESTKDTDYVTCPIVATTWQLFRLGKLGGGGGTKFSDDDFKAYSTKAFIGNKTFTVIPKKFMRVESDVFDIISSIKSFKKIGKKIKYIFY